MSLNISIHRDITGEMWFGVGQKITPNFKSGTMNGEQVNGIFPSAQSG